MELVFVALPVALVIAGAALAAFLWAARHDQFEDLDTPARRMLFEDEPVEGERALQKNPPDRRGKDRLGGKSAASRPDF